ncbi:MAG: NADH-quinone oxidoreductase subunit L [Armatimonadota bacterium]|nr:NADH-quinone oxidoreductase subunit L [bacterium]
MIDYTWLIPLLPVVAFVLIIAFGRKLPGQGAYVAIFGMLSSLVMSAIVAAQWFLGAHEGPFSVVVPWMPVGNVIVDMGFSVDALTCVMLLVVTIVASMVMIYSTGYMHGDKRYPRYFAYLSLFSAAMLALVIANNILLMFMAWELVGLTSYLLIGFWFEKPSAMKAAKKAFLVTRVGDVGFMAGMMLLFIKTGSFNLFGSHGVFENLDKLQALVHVGPWMIPLAGLAALLLFCGAVGKSAQFPLHVWLPDAMEGPTPVSALIHAATMVAAGVYLVARMYPVYLADASGVALHVVAYTGAFTALFAASIGIAQNDIKKVLAYSTVSQLGYMIMALGVFGYVAAIFHLMTHAFFKAQLFLSSGSVIHGTGTQDIREMGGLKRKMPWTYWTMLIATLSLCGIPFITAGGWSKEEILTVAFHTNKIVFWAGVLGAFTTSFYMFRLIYKTFHGEPQNHEIHAHESPKVMLVPLVILAILAICAGWVGTPFKNAFEHSMMPVLGHHYESILERTLEEARMSAGFNVPVFAIGTLAALLGILFATLIWKWHLIKIEKLEPAFGWLAKIVENKYYIDEIYQVTIIRGIMLAAAMLFWFDKWVIDYLIVNGFGYMCLVVSRVWGWCDRNIVDGLVNLTGWVTGSMGKALRHLQTGVAQQYVFLLVVSIALISIVALTAAVLGHSEVSWIPPITGFFR